MKDSFIFLFMYKTKILSQFNSCSLRKIGFYLRDPDWGKIAFFFLFIFLHMVFLVLIVDGLGTKHSQMVCKSVIIEEFVFGHMGFDLYANEI